MRVRNDWVRNDRVRNDRVRNDRVRSVQVRNDRGLEMIGLEMIGLEMIGLEMIVNRLTLIHFSPVNDFLFWVRTNYTKINEVNVLINIATRCIHFKRYNESVGSLKTTKIIKC